MANGFNFSVIVGVSSLQVLHPVIDAANRECDKSAVCRPEVPLPTDGNDEGAPTHPAPAGGYVTRGTNTATDTYVPPRREPLPVFEDDSHWSVQQNLRIQHNNRAAIIVSQPGFLANGTRVSTDGWD
jgi:hypothetical protein